MWRQVRKAHVWLYERIKQVRHLDGLGPLVVDLEVEQK